MREEGGGRREEGGGRREEGEKKDEGRKGYIIKEGRVDYIWKQGSWVAITLEQKRRLVYDGTRV